MCTCDNCIYTQEEQEGGQIGTGEEWKKHENQYCPTTRSNKCTRLLDGGGDDGTKLILQAYVINTFIWDYTCTWQ